MVSVFQVGKYYRHSSGEMMHVVSAGKTTLYGWCLIAETTNRADLKPIGNDEDATANWKESTELEWMKNFS